MWRDGRAWLVKSTSDPLDTYQSWYEMRIQASHAPNVSELHNKMLQFDLNKVQGEMVTPVDFS
jgi:hypothetical protein